jgi:hypothetical protein
MATLAFPAAEAFARRMELPVVRCSVHRELYGITHWVLNARAATAALCKAGFLTHYPSHQLAMGILKERAERLNDQTRSA